MTDGGLAIDAIKTIYDSWRVNADRAQWVGDPSAAGLLREGYGFDWWPGDFKVKVRVVGPHPELDRPVFQLSVQTDFLCNVDVTTAKFKRILSGFNQGFQPLRFALIRRFCRRLWRNMGLPVIWGWT
jgi:hypothetical protein